MAEPPSSAPTAPSLMPMITGTWLSQAICAAARLGLPDLLADGPRPAAELANTVGAHAPSLLRLLRVLAAAGVFRETELGLFASTPLGLQLQSGVPGSLRNLAMVVGAEEARRSWSHLLYSLRTGEPAFCHIFGTDTFDYRAERPDEAAIFNEAMAEMTRQVAHAVVASYDFSGIGVIVDVGGGNGALLSVLLAAVPTLTSILFDLPSGTAVAVELLGAAGVAGRCRIVEGDVFAAVPDGADAYMLKSVIHDWDDERSRIILKNCARAMPRHSRLLLHEQLLPVRAEELAAHRRVLLTDLNMLVMTGGRERSESEYRALLGASGLRLKRIVPAGPSFSILDAVLG
jgi:hypothetical protein